MLSQLSIIQYVGVCVFSLPISFVMIERTYIYIYTLSYYNHQIGSINYYPLFRVRSWNNGMRCMSFYILMGRVIIFFRASEWSWFVNMEHYCSKWQRRTPGKDSKHVWAHLINTLRRRQNGRHFVIDTFERIFLKMLELRLKFQWVCS